MTVKPSGIVYVRRSVTATPSSSVAKIAGQDGGQDGTGIQLDAGQKPQFAQGRGGHFLGFIDQDVIETAVELVEHPLDRAG
mgnify:CR=1 FL=1